MNDDDKELFGIVKDTIAHIKLILVKSMRNSDDVTWGRHAAEEIKNSNFFPNNAKIRYTKMYEIEGCKDYFLVLASSKIHKDNHSYVPEIKEIIKGLYDAYIKNMCSQKPGDKLVKLKHRGLDIIAIDRTRDKMLSVLKLLYPSIVAYRKEANKPQKPTPVPTVTQKEITRLVESFNKSKKVRPDTAEVAVVAQPIDLVKWSDIKMTTISKLKFLLKATLTPTTHPNSKLVGYAVFADEKNTGNKYDYAEDKPTRKIKTTWTVEAQQDFKSANL